MKCIRTLSILSLLALFGLAAARPAAATSHVSETTFTVPAGETITLQVSAFGLESGQPFPESVSLGTRKAPIDARRVMKAAAQAGAIDYEVLQTQLAIWRAVEGDWGIDEDDDDFALAAALYDASVRQNTAPLEAQGLPLNAVLLDGRVEVAVAEWYALDAEPIHEDDEPYYGRATLDIRNTSDEGLDLYMPLGLILEAGDEDEQDMGIAAVEGPASMMTDDADEGDADLAALEDSSTEDEADREEAGEEVVDEGAAGTEYQGAEGEGAETETTAHEASVEDWSYTDEPEDLPVTGLPGVPDTLLAMILGAIILSAGLVLRRA